MDTSTKLAESQDLAGRIASLFQKRLQAAVADHAARVQAAHTQYAESCKAIPGNMQQPWSGELCCNLIAAGVGANVALGLVSPVMIASPAETDR